MKSSTRTALKILLVLPWILILVGALYAAWRFLPDRPVTYTDPEEHFKYGSTGGERELGFPLLIWQVMPDICPDKLPGKGYESLGMHFEPGKDLPVGMSTRRNLGLDRVFLNCAACHTNTWRESPDSEVHRVSAMPANSFDIMAFQKFLFDCAGDARFSADRIVPVIEQRYGKLGLLDHYLIYPVAVAIMRDRVLTLRERFRYIYEEQPWGPGRVDTFNAAKILFNIPIHRLPKTEREAGSDFPSVWNQGPKKGMQLHWDGNNTRVEERNLSASFGTGALPASIDHDAIARIERWLETAKPPPYPFPVDKSLAETGKPIYQQYCADCHGASGQDFSGAKVGKVTALADIGTDPQRLNSYTRALATQQSLVYASDDPEEDRLYRFKHFRKTFGYANMPLDGLWLRAPYLHNGSVPTLRDLLNPVSARPGTFYRGNDVYDPVRVGFVSDKPQQGERKFFLYNTQVIGNGNTGHEGARYGTELSDTDKSALLEYLKTF